MIGKKLLKNIKVAREVWSTNWRYSGEYAREGVIGKRRLPLFLDMLHSEITTGSDCGNYYMFGFDKLSQSERKEWITNHFNAHIAARHSGKEIWRLFLDKARFNARFHDFVHRQWVDTRQSTPEAIREMVERLGTVIVKPFNLSKGDGIYLLRSDEKEQLESLLAAVAEGHHCLIEEVKENVPELKALNPTSLNTIRIVTCIDSHGEVRFLCTVIRIGSTEGCTDNSYGGGITCYIDPETGRINSKAVDRRRHYLTHHPLTGISLIGYQIPRWHEVLDFARSAALVEPRAHYVGWDIAVCPDGLELIEGNIPPGEGIIQVCDGVPKRRLLVEYLK